MVDSLKLFNELWQEIEKDINAIGSIYPSVGKSLYDEPKTRLAQRIANKILNNNYKTIKILKLISNTSLANNLCPDHRDKIAGRECLMCELERIKKACDIFEKNSEGASNLWEENLQLKLENQRLVDKLEGIGVLD